MLPLRDKRDHSSRLTRNRNTSLFSLANIWALIVSATMHCLSFRTAPLNRVPCGPLQVPRIVAVEPLKRKRSEGA